MLRSFREAVMPITKLVLLVKSEQQTVRYNRKALKTV